MTPSPLPTRADLERSPRELLSRGGPRNPDVYRVTHAGRALVVKDFAPRSLLVRSVLGPWITRREARAWARLRGHPQVPCLVGRIDALAFAVEYRPGRRMSRKLVGQVPPDFGERLERGLAEMHRRGVVHLDLRHRSNVLVGEQGDPVLIDFGSALCFRPGSFAARTLLPPLARLDLRAARKWRRKLALDQAPSEGSGDSGGSSGSGRSMSRPT